MTKSCQWHRNECWRRNDQRQEHRKKVHRRKNERPLKRRRLERKARGRTGGSERQSAKKVLPKRGFDLATTKRLRRTRLKTNGKTEMAENWRDGSETQTPTRRRHCTYGETQTQTTLHRRHWRIFHRQDLRKKIGSNGLFRTQVKSQQALKAKRLRDVQGGSICC